MLAGPFRPLALIALPLGLVVAIALGASLVQPTYSDLWPMGLFRFRTPSWVDVVVAASAATIVFEVVRASLRGPRSPAWIVGAGLAITLFVGIVPGIVDGLVTPILEYGYGYVHDLKRVEGPWQFLVDFSELQPRLGVHSRTHPPGAVLLIYTLQQLARHPLGISLVLAVGSSCLSLVYLRRLLARELAGDVTFACVLFAIVPAVGIYYVTSLDALFAGMLLAAVFHFTETRWLRGSLLAAAWLVPASFASFGFLFVLPVLAVFELWSDRTVKRLVVVVGVLCAAYGLLYLASGFSYVDAFAAASRSENPEGFRLFADPGSWAASRLGGLLEITIGLSPVLAGGVVGGMALLRREHRRLFVLAAAALVTLALYLASGVLKTGEMARGGLFIYPFLMLPIAAVLGDPRHLAARPLVAALVVGQVLLMQLFGAYVF